MSKSIFWSVAAVLLVTVAVLVFFLVRADQQNSVLNATVEEFKNSSIAEQVEQQQSAQQTIAEGLSAQATLQAQIGGLQAQAVKDQALNSTLTAEDAALRSELFCADQKSFQPDYAGNMEMSAALKTYVAKITGLSVATATWESIWTGANTSTHTIYFYRDNQRIKLPYLVFFIEKGMNLKEGVFDINNQCWLDRK